jgi:hypothetical protein
MSKPKSEQLFRLIKSLSKAEKKAFKLFASRYGNSTDGEGKIFSNLFDCVEQQSIYNEEEILAAIKKLKPAQMSNMKAHLYQQILKCLSVICSQNSVDLNVTEKIDHARILYNKCLYRDCLKMIDKAKATAIESENRLLLLELIELEKMAIKQTVEENIQERVSKVIAESEQTAKTISNINSFSNLSIKLSAFYNQIGFIRNVEDLDTVKNYFNHNLPDYDIEFLTVHELIYLYYSYCSYYYFIQDFEEGYYYAKKWMATFEDHPVMISRKPEMYIKALNNVLIAQHKLNLYTDFYETHRKLANLKRNKKIGFTANVNLNLFKTFYIHEINRHFMTGEFTKGTQIVTKLTKELNTLIPLLDKQTILIFYYKISCLYFGSGDYKTCLKWLNKIINEQVSDIREDIHVFARIIRLISYYELGNRDQIDNQIKSTYRFLSKTKHLSEYHQLIILFLKNLHYSKAELRNSFISLKTNLLELEKDLFEKRAFIYFDIISWLESKIENKPVEEICQQKFLHTSNNTASPV